LIELRIFILYFKNISYLRKDFESSIHPPPPLELGLNLILHSRHVKIVIYNTIPNDRRELLDALPLATLHVDVERG